MAIKPGDEWPPGAKRRPFFHRVARPSVYATDAEALKTRTLVRGVGSFGFNCVIAIASRLTAEQKTIRRVYFLNAIDLGMEGA
jgi:hypothetical protein